MSLKLYCSLCLTPSTEYKLLQNDKGDFNDIYKITIKYFDPMLLTTDEKSDKYPQKNYILCQSCWMPIKNFNEFQENVIRTRSLLEKIIVEVEDDDQIDVVINHKNAHCNYKSGNGGGNYSYSYENAYVKPDLHLDPEDQKVISDKTAVTHSLLQKTPIKVECNDQVDIQINNKNTHDNYNSDDSGGNYAYSYEKNVYVKPDLDLEADYQDQEFISDEEMMTRLHDEMEWEDQVNERVDQKKGDDNYKSGDDDGNYAYSYGNYVYVKPDLDLDADYEEQQFTSDEDDDDEDDDEDDAEVDDEDNEDEKPLNYFQNNSIDKSKILPQEKQVKITTSEANKKPDNKKSWCWQKAHESDAIIAEWKPVLECDLCEESFSTLNKLRKHFREKHKSIFYVKCCERKFSQRHLLVSHIVQCHLNTKGHKCDICGKALSPQFLKMHKKLMHGQIEQVECKFCHKKMLKSRLSQHLITHATKEKNFFDCKDCSKVFTFEGQLKAHIKRVHVDLKKKQCGTESISFACDVCDIELDSLSRLNKHMVAFHNDDSTFYVCSICGKVKPSAKSVLNHMKLVHEKKERKCSYCDKAFQYANELRVHIAVHTGQSLYRCLHCPRAYKARSNMSRHCKKAHPVEWLKSRKNRLPVFDKSIHLI